MTRPQGARPNSVAIVAWLKHQQNCATYAVPGHWANRCPLMSNMISGWPLVCCLMDATNENSCFAPVAKSRTAAVKHRNVPPLGLRHQLLGLLVLFCTKHAPHIPEGRIRPSVSPETQSPSSIDCPHGIQCPHHHKPMHGLPPAREAASPRHPETYCTKSSPRSMPSPSSASSSRWPVRAARPPGLHGAGGHLAYVCEGHILGGVDEAAGVVPGSARSGGAAAMRAGTHDWYPMNSP